MQPGYLVNMRHECVLSLFSRLIAPQEYCNLQPFSIKDKLKKVSIQCEGLHINYFFFPRTLSEINTSDKK